MNKSITLMMIIAGLVTAVDVLADTIYLVNKSSYPVRAKWTNKDGATLDQGVLKGSFLKVEELVGACTIKADINGEEITSAIAIGDREFMYAKADGTQITGKLPVRAIMPGVTGEAIVFVIDVGAIRPAGKIAIEAMALSEARKKYPNPLWPSMQQIMDAQMRRGY